MKLGFIGCGNMAKAMIRGILNGGLVSSEKIIASSKTESTLEKVEKEFNINVDLNNKRIAKESNIVFLAIKPQKYEDIIEEIRDVVEEETIIISIAPGFTIEELESLFSRQIKIIRAMPNTPVMVGEGMTAISKNQLISEEDLKKVEKVFESFGKVELIDESMMDAAVAVGGSSPAYIFILIESMADAAVLEGMDRKTAYTFASQAVLGSAKMVLETKEHPGKLKDMVCSPGGTTIEAVKVLEKEGFRSSIIEAMVSCSDKSKNM